MLIYADALIEKNLLIDNKTSEKIKKSHTETQRFRDEIPPANANNQGLVPMWIKIKMCRVNKVMEKRNTPLD